MITPKGRKAGACVALAIACALFAGCETFGTYSGQASTDASGTHVNGGIGLTAQNSGGGSVTLSGNGTVQTNDPNWSVGASLTGSQNVNGATVSLTGNVNTSQNKGTSWGVGLKITGRF